MDITWYSVFVQAIMRVRYSPLYVLWYLAITTYFYQYFGHIYDRGFKDIATAEMMMKRAKKHKQPHANTVKAKKLAGQLKQLMFNMDWVTIYLDPKVRLAQFKAKQQESVAIKCVHCRARKRKEYFQCENNCVYYSIL